LSFDMRITSTRRICFVAEFLIGMSEVACFGLVLFWVSGCSSSSSLTSTPDIRALSLWGGIFIVGQAEQGDAPAMALTDAGIAFAWVGADDTGVHQDARIFDGTNGSEHVVLPLPPVHPYNQQIVIAGLGGIHFLWLDAEDTSASDSRLFSAFINRRLQNELGPIRVSDRATLRYDYVSNADGSLWVVWSGGQVVEPSLYGNFVDASSRPRDAQLLTPNADYPTLIRTVEGTVVLFWMQVSTHRVYRAILGDGVLSDAQSVTSAPTLERGDRLVSMKVGLDSTEGYLFWNVTRADGTFETWYAHGLLDSTTWSVPKRLGIEVVADETFVTGYNSGTAQEATNGDLWLSWGSPATGQYDVLAVAGQIGDGLAVIYFSGGEVVGYQGITTLTHRLIGMPKLLTDRNRHLYLSWSEPNLAGFSELKFTQTAR
jgi:hypothetical protein